jgi:hypothetical protein
MQNNLTTKKIISQKDNLCNWYHVPVMQLMPGNARREPLVMGKFCGWWIAPHMLQER